MPLDEECVWARTEPGRQTRMSRAEAERNGYEVAPPPPPYEAGGIRFNTVTPHLSKEEQVKLSEQTGREIRDYDDLKRYYRETGCRSMERGEKQDLARRAMAEGAPTPDATAAELMGKQKNSVDIRKLYEEIRSR